MVIEVNVAVESYRATKVTRAPGASSAVVANRATKVGKTTRATRAATANGATGIRKATEASKTTEISRRVIAYTRATGATGATSTNEELVVSMYRLEVTADSVGLSILDKVTEFSLDLT